MTISELLATPYYRGNKSLLAKELDVYRATVLLYSKDTEGKHHFIRKNGAHGTAELFTNQSNKVSK